LGVVAAIDITLASDVRGNDNVLSAVARCIFDGDHSADWWMVALTALGAAAIFYQLRQARCSSDAQLKAIAGQVKQSSQEAARQLAEMEAARKGNLRPFLVFERAALLPPDVNDLAVLPNKRFVELTLVNHGPGPVVDAVLRVWVFPTSIRKVADLGEWERFIADCDAKVKTTKELGSIRIHSMGPNSTAIQYLAPERHAHVEVGPGNAVICVSATYRDVFGSEFLYPPPKSPAKIEYIYRVAQIEIRPPKRPAGDGSS
jgi:hypothetical protein